MSVLVQAIRLDDMHRTQTHLAADLTGLKDDTHYISSTGDHTEEMMKRVIGNATPRPAPSQSARRRRRHLSRRYAQAALRAERAAHRGPPASATPDEAYAHLPVQVRGPMVGLGEMYINKAIHRNLSILCATAKNRRMKDVDALFVTEEMVSLSTYIVPLARCTPFAQWQGRALVLQAPSDAVHETRSPSKMAKLIVLMYFSTGNTISANLTPREHLNSPHGCPNDGTGAPLTYPAWTLTSLNQGSWLQAPQSTRMASPLLFPCPSLPRKRLYRRYGPFVPVPGNPATWS